MFNSVIAALHVGIRIDGGSAAAYLCMLIFRTPTYCLLHIGFMLLHGLMHAARLPGGQILI